MIPQSLPSSPVRLPPDPSTPPSPSSLTAAERLDRLNQLTGQGDAAGIRSLLLAHPTAFAHDMPGWWRIAFGHGLDLKSLFGELGPHVQLPPLQLDGFEWDTHSVCSASLCHPGLKALRLHRCLLTDDAWTDVARDAHQAFGEHPSALQRLAITADLPGPEALESTQLVSTESMAQWVGQLAVLEDLTLSGFLGHGHGHHISYSHVFMAARDLPLKRLALEGFMPRAFASPRIGPALTGLLRPDRPPLCLSLNGWRWQSSAADHAQSPYQPVDTAIEKALGQIFLTASSHLTIELINMFYAQRITARVVTALPGRQQDVSWRLGCPQDPRQQRDMPLHTRGIELHPLHQRSVADLPALRGLHVQFNDASAWDIDVAQVLPKCSRLATVTLVIRAVPGGFRRCAQRIDEQLSRAIEALPGLQSLELRTDYDLEHLPRVQARLAANRLTQV